MAATDRTANILTGNTRAGTLVATFNADAVNGDKFSNNGQIRVLVTNPAGGGGSATAAFTIRETTTDPDVTLSNGGGTVAAGAARIFGPFPAKRWNDATGFLTMSITGGNTPTVTLIG